MRRVQIISGAVLLVSLAGCSLSYSSDESNDSQAETTDQAQAQAAQAEMERVANETTIAAFGNENIDENTDKSTEESTDNNTPTPTIP